jgi:hypothetical protein
MMMILSYYFGKKHYPVPYNLKRILGYLFSSVILSIIVLNTNNNYYINTVLVLVFLGFVYQLEKSDLKKLLKRS